MRAPCRGATRLMFGLLPLLGPLSARGQEGGGHEVVRSLRSRESARVVYVHRSQGEVGYLAARIAPVDAAGQPVEALSSRKAGGAGLLASGRLSVTATKEDLADLGREARDVLGKDSKLIEVRPISFAMWMTLGDEVLWKRPDGAGSTRGIPVTALIPAARGEEKANVVMAASWGEQLPPLRGKLKIDWEALAGSLQKEAGLGGGLSEARLATIAERSLETHVVKVELEGDGNAAEVAPLLRLILAGEIRKRLLESPAPAETHERDEAGTTPEGAREKRPDVNEKRLREGRELSLVYRIRKDLRVKSLASTLDLGLSRHVARVTVITSSIPIGRE